MGETENVVTDAMVVAAVEAFEEIANRDGYCERVLHEEVKPGWRKLGWQVEGYLDLTSVMRAALTAAFAHRGNPP